jgi:hypothetical protein
MSDKPRIKKFIRFYENEEIESLNILFDKNINNNWFTQEELAFASDVDLLNRKNLEKAKEDWINSKFE